MKLHPKKGEKWTEGWIHFSRPVEVDATGIVLTYSVQTDRARGEDAGAVYTKLHFTKDPARREQVSINVTVRPSDRWYMLYVDPGWEMQNKHYRTVQPPPKLFGNPETPERFRLTATRAGDKIVATLAHWDPKENTWVLLRTAEGQDRIEPSIAADLENQASVKSLSFQFPGDFSVVTNVTLERGEAGKK